MRMGETKPEPSMEDILASIKRIIADDSQAAAAAVSHVEEVNASSSGARNPAKPLHLVESRDDAAGSSSNPEEVLELTQPIDAVGKPMPFPLADESESPSMNVRSHVQEAESPPAPLATAKPSERATADRSPPSAPATPILSEDAASASRQSLAALSALLVKPESDAAPNTLDGLVREMLRPMLKDWLDQRLPELVEKLVEKEIARITGRLG